MIWISLLLLKLRCVSVLTYIHVPERYCGSDVVVSLVARGILRDEWQGFSLQLLSVFSFPTGLPWYCASDTTRHLSAMNEAYWPCVHTGWLLKIYFFVCIFFGTNWEWVDLNWYRYVSHKTPPCSMHLMTTKIKTTVFSRCRWDLWQI